MSWMEKDVPYTARAMTHYDEGMRMAGIEEIRDIDQRIPCGIGCALWQGGVFRGASPKRGSLQPRAAGAVIEVTKGLKPSVKRVTNT